ncbi:hypothetical protein [Rhodanobacter sp. A1T4]|uniref:hypothetical protein n=1 Tax=Rhodanobacter sp. A1T4 TaxID=2723087 RepID=UPI0017B2F27C|nr:hypothetical protein [Rhodanobacter sp. A1T4]MBB6248734.1 hypothetical protein [Rhodanobacter sp. A1T4]
MASIGRPKAALRRIGDNATSRTPTRQPLGIALLASTATYNFSSTAVTPLATNYDF